MASQVDNGFATFQATAAVSAFRVVEMDASGYVKHVVTEGTKGIGVTQEDAAAAGFVNIRLWGAPGSSLITVTGTAVTPNNGYMVGALGYIVASTGTAQVKATQAGVASAGIVLEFLEL